jgi:glycerol-3-phosphate dehydrogenase
MNRITNLARLRTETFDVCIIGGGATGAGCALDAASRGLSTALIDQDDFGAATSSTSTKLIHGGVRYLEQAFKTFDAKQLDLVKKALHERKTLLQIAPHLAHPLALLTPCENWFEGAYFSIGLKLYDLLAGSRQLEPSRWLSKSEAITWFPAFNKKQLHSAVLYYDGQFDDVRLNLALAQTANEQGAAVANHLKAKHFQHDETGNLISVTVEDKLSGKSFAIHAKTFVNATGTRADALRQDANQEQGVRMRASKGSHVVMRAGAVGKTSAALLVPKTADGRVLFAIPWRGHYLIGTTDTEADPTETPYLLPGEAEYLVKHVSHYLTKPLDMSDVTGGFAGLRPLLQADPNADTKSLVRDHEVEIDPQSGLVSIMGGKWTTYRLMAQDTINACCARLNQSAKAITETLPLSGGEGYDEAFTKRFAKETPTLPADVAEHLTNSYGVRAAKVAQLIADEPALADRLATNHPFIGAEVVYAVREEMAQTLPDVLMRRIRLGVVDWVAALEALPVVTQLMARELGWSATETAEHEKTFGATVMQMMEQAGMRKEVTA